MGGKRFITVILLVTAFIVSFFVAYLAVPALAAAAFLFSSTRRKERLEKDRVKREALSFLRGLAKGDLKPFAKRVLDSANGSYTFSKKISDSLEYYYRSSSAKRFMALMQYRSECLSETVLLIIDALENGSDVDSRLVKLLGKHEYLGELRMRHVGSLENSISLVQVGNMAFFPAFAGICKNISGITMSSGFSMPFTVLILAYVAIVSISSSFFARASSKAYNAIAMFCIGASIFNIAGFASSLML